MKHAKRLVLAAFAATVLLAFTGAGSASAATEVSWCHTSEGHAAEHGCPAGWAELNGQKVKVATSTFTWAFGSFAITCASTMEGTLGLGASATITGLTFTGCSGSCTEASAVNLPYSAQGVHGTGTNGTLTISGNPGWEWKHCTVFNVNCTFGKASMSLTFDAGPEEGMKEATKLKGNIALTRTAGSALCPESGTWAATYTAQSGTGLTPLIAMWHHI